MGTFFFLSAVRSTESARVEQCLREISERQGFEIQSQKPSDFDDCLFPSRQQGAWTCVQYQTASLGGCGVTQELSARFRAPAFFFQIYDGDVWGYWFFDVGQELGKFVSVPECYDEAADQPGEWRGAIEVLGERLGIKDVSTLKKYLVHLDPEDPSVEKVQANDEFELSDPWVIADFLRKLDILWDEQGADESALYLVKRK